MAKVSSAVEILPKFQPPEYSERALQMTDGRATANSGDLYVARVTLVFYAISKPSICTKKPEPVNVSWIEPETGLDK